MGPRLCAALGPRPSDPRLPALQCPSVAEAAVWRPPGAGPGTPEWAGLVSVTINVPVGEWLWASRLQGRQDRPTDRHTCRKTHGRAQARAGPGSCPSKMHHTRLREHAQAACPRHRACSPLHPRHAGMLQPPVHARMLSLAGRELRARAECSERWVDGSRSPPCLLPAVLVGGPAGSVHVPWLLLRCTRPLSWAGEGAPRAASGALGKGRPHAS